MGSKVLWTLRAIDESGVPILSRQVELDFQGLDDQALDTHAGRFVAFLKVGKVGPRMTIEHAIDAPADVRERLTAAVDRTRQNDKS